MSLDTHALAKEVEAAYVEYIKFDIETRTFEYNDKGQYIQPTDEERFIWADKFAKAYHKYAKKGVILGAVSSGSNPNYLRDAMYNVPSGGEDATEGIATAMIQYWSEFGISAGYPAHGGVAWVSTSNNFSSLSSPMISQIKSAYTTEEKTPYYKHLFDNIESLVKSAVWTTIEVDSDGKPIITPETIS